MLGTNYGVGLHRFSPKRFPAVFLDVSDAQYNPLDPGEIIAGIHPAEQPGRYGVAKFRDGRVTAKALMQYSWGGYEFYIDAEENLLYVATGTNTIEVRDLENLELRERITVPVSGVTSVALDSEARLWFISNPMSGGDGGLYLVTGGDSPTNIRRIREYSIPASLDSLRINPWGRKLLVADYGRHVVECISEEGESLGTIYFPYVSGVKWTLDERVLLSSGKYGKHVFLLLMTGALHNTARSGWFGYVADYGTQASNRADAFYLDRVLIQWYLGFSELQLPLPKNAPYTIRVGSGEFGEGEYIGEKGFHSFTPILVLNEGYVISRPRNIDLELEVMVPYHHIIAPKPKIEWESMGEFRGKIRVEVPGIYRVRTLSKCFVELYAVCKP